MQGLCRVNFGLFVEEYIDSELDAVEHIALLFEEQTRLAVVYLMFQHHVHRMQMFTTFLQHDHEMQILIAF